MSIMHILIYPDPLLREKALEVEKFGPDLEAFSSSLLETMYTYSGVGLAAPQVGVLKRIFVMDVNPEGEGTPLVFVNPEIVARSTETHMVDEGCLSFPGVTELVSRFTQVTVRAKDEKGQVFEVTLEGLGSQCAQHEIEHLDGHVLVDNIGRAKRRFITKNLKNRKKTKGLRYTVPR